MTPLFSPCFLNPTSGRLIINNLSLPPKNLSLPLLLELPLRSERSTSNSIEKTFELRSYNQTTATFAGETNNQVTKSTSIESLHERKEPKKTFSPQNVARRASQVVTGYSVGEEPLDKSLDIPLDLIFRLMLFKAFTTVVAEVMYIHVVAYA